MAILTIDTTCGLTVGVVSSDGLNTLAFMHLEDTRKHVEMIAPYVESVLSESNCNVSDIEKVVVGRGPAPFTGLRVGLAFSRVFSLALGVKESGISSLLVEAEFAKRKLLGCSELGADFGVGCSELGAVDYIFVATDARRKQVYFALYEVTRNLGTGLEINEVIKPSVDTAEVANEQVKSYCAQKGKIAFVGTNLYEDVFAELGFVIQFDTAYKTSESALIMAQLAPKLADANTSPLYLRRPDVG